MNDSLIERLSRSRSVLQRRRLLSGLLWNLLTTAGLLFALAGVNAAFTLREDQAFILALPVLGLFLVRLLWDSYQAFVVPPTLPHLAAELERENPRWMDALICAVEREEKSSDKLRPLERALVAKMRRETRSVDFTELLLPPRLRTGVLTVGGIVLVLLLWPALGNEYSQKARAYFSDLIAGELTGVSVTPGTAEIPVETDLTIQAAVVRWEDTARVEYIDERGRHDYPMHDGGDDHHFTFYNVTDPIRYRVHTPSLTSPWHRVTPYVPPAIENYRLTVTPPAYTGEETRTHQRIRDLTVLEGSDLHWELELPAGVTAFLENGVNRVRLEEQAKGSHHLQQTLDGNRESRFHMEDEHGRTARSDRFALTAARDYPPTIDVREPGSDIDAQPKADVAIRASIADDYGLREARLHLSVSGDRRVERALYAVDRDRAADALPREREVEYRLDLENLDVAEGDIITYFLTATDNREPDPQTTRSEVFFIEVREEREPEEMEGDPMDQEEIDIRALLVEMKRLIRMSWETIGLDGERRESLAQELALSMEALRIETSGITQEIIELAGGNEEHPVIQLMHGAENRMASAGRLIQADRIEDSVPYQEQALAHLLAVENMLARDPIRSDEPSDEAGEAGEGESGEGEEADEEAMEEMLADLRRLIATIRELADVQTSHNSTLGRLAGSDVTDDQREELGRRQRDLLAGAREVRRELNRVPGAGEAWRQMDAAAGFMDQAVRQTGMNRIERAEREGARARSSLLTALEELESLLESATTSELEQLVQWADALAEEQGASASASRAQAEQAQPDSDELAALRDRQETTRDSFEDLLSALDDQALELQDEHPEVAEALFSLAINLRDDNVGGDMERAANALLYEQPDRAAEIQEALAGRLESFGQELREAGEGLPAFSRQELAEALDEIQRARREIEEMFGQSGEDAMQRMRDLSREVGETLGGIGRGMNDGELQEMSGSLLGQEGAEAERPNPFRLESVLSAASRSLEQRILAMELERRVRLSRQGSEPPEKYRNLVEQYFRNLSEQQ